MRMRIGNRLMLFFIAVALTASISGITGTVILYVINGYYSKAVEEYSSKTTSISLIYGNTCIVRTYVSDVILSDDMALKKMSWNKVQEVGRSIDPIMEALRPRMQNKEELTLCEILHSV